MDMAIVNAGALPIYDDIESELRHLCEVCTVFLYRRWGQRKHVPEGLVLKISFYGPTLVRREHIIGRGGYPVILRDLDRRHAEPALRHCLNC